MKKTAALWVLLYSVFLAVFNTIFFLLGGTEHSASVWISYGFIHFAYVMVVVTALMFSNKSNVVTLGLSLSSIAFAYFLAELFIGLIFILIGSNIYKAALTVQIIVLGVYLVLLLINMITNIHTAENSKQHAKEEFFIKESASKVKSLIGKITDSAVDKELEAVYDLLHSSPVKSSDKVKAIEADIRSKIAYLENAVNCELVPNIAILSKEITSLVEERNRLLKISN